jgi:hypothetical protein
MSWSVGSQRTGCETAIVTVCRALQVPELQTLIAQHCAESIIQAEADLKDAQVLYI